MRIVAVRVTNQSQKNTMATGRKNVYPKNDYEKLHLKNSSKLFIYTDLYSEWWLHRYHTCHPVRPTDHSWHRSRLVLLEVEAKLAHLDAGRSGGFAQKNHVSQGETTSSMNEVNESTQISQNFIHVWCF